MGKRLSKIYTRTGDGGETGLGDGSRVSKTHERVEAMGTVDELNAFVGVVIESLATEDAEELGDCVAFLQKCQHRIFDLGGEISIPGFNLITAHHVDAVEAELDRLNANLEPLENFIMPGGSPMIANCHLARAVCRRAERRLLTLAQEEPVNACGQQYLNRLSDYLFVLARYCAFITNTPEVLWQKDDAPESHEDAS